MDLTSLSLILAVLFGWWLVIPAKMNASGPLKYERALLPLHGQAEPPSVKASGPIATDWPAVTNPGVVVPVGSQHAENGFLENSSRRVKRFRRSGERSASCCAKRTELRFTMSDYFHNANTGDGRRPHFFRFRNRVWPEARKKASARTG
jgi:hypothetical protein